MMKILLFIVISLAVTHSGNSANVDRKSINEEKVSFIDKDNDESLLDKIREDMENYKKSKEMFLKRKSENQTKPTVTEATSTVSPDSRVADEPTKASVPSSTKLLQIVLVGAAEEDNAFDGLGEGEEETTTSALDDRFIINAPTVCKDGRVAVMGKCRVVS